MDRSDFIKMIRRRWIIIAFVIVVIVGGVLAYSFTQSPIYEATATCIVSAAPNADSQYATVQVITQLMQTISRIAVTRPVLKDASEKVGGAISLENLENTVTSNVITNTQIIQITARDEKPEKAGFKANAVADSLIEFFNQRNSENKSYQIEKVESANTPDSPVSPKPIRNGIIALFLGILLGIACAALVDSLKSA